LGQDVSYHWLANVHQAAVLGGNAARFAAGGLANPTIGIIEDGVFPGGPWTYGMLHAVGLTNLTEISPANLGTTNLRQFQVLEFGPTVNTTDIAYYQAAAPQIQAYISGGGGLVVEPEESGESGTQPANAWSWVPYASQIGPIVDEQDNAFIATPNHPIMIG